VLFSEGSVQDKYFVEQNGRTAMSPALISTKWLGLFKNALQTMEYKYIFSLTAFKVLFFHTTPTNSLLGVLKKSII